MLKSRLNFEMSFQRVCDVGGADGPFEMVYAFVGGVMPGGRVILDGTLAGTPGDAREVTWRQMRAWQCIAYFWRVAFLEYNREL